VLDVDALLSNSAEPAIVRELATRQLTRKHLLHFILRFHPDYLAGWVHREICYKLEEFAARVLRRESPRLLIAMPPRHGKSLIASQYFPAWFLGNNPRAEFINCSYALSLQAGFSRKVRTLLQDPVFAATFKDCTLDPNAQNIEGWLTTAGGGFKPAGRGGPVSGFGCIAEGTLISTPTGAVKIEDLIRLWYNTDVVVNGYDHKTGEVKPCRIIATKETKNREVIRIITSGGRHLDLTPDHRIYVVEHGYREAESLRPGDRVLVYPEKTTECGVCPMWKSEKARGSSLSGVLFRAALQQRAGEFGNLVHWMPHDSPQVEYDTIQVVKPLCGRRVTVYDMQVEGTSNLFAGEILAHNCTVLVLDDLIKNSQEAESVTLRESTWDWYTSTARTRLQPGGGILAVGTRWHHDDPMGRLEAGSDEFGDVFDVVRYPAIATHDELYRKTGEALHPERYDLKELRAIQSTSQDVWEALFQQNPTPDTGGYFDLGWFKYYDQVPSLLRTFMAWDLAISKKERADWTVGVVGGLTEMGDLYILDTVRSHMDSMEIVDSILDMHTRYDTFLCGIEQGHLSMAIAPMLNAQIQARKAYTLAVKEIPPGRRDKESRARSLQGRLRQGRVYFPRHADWLGEFKAEFAQFPSSKHDDQVDAASYLALMLDDVPPPRPVVEPTTPAWMTRLTDLSRFTATSRFMEA